MFRVWLRVAETFRANMLEGFLGVQGFGDPTPPPSPPTPVGCYLFLAGSSRIRNFRVA